MVEEEKPKTKEEKTLSILDQIKEQKADLDLKITEITRLNEETKTLRAEELLSGRSNQTPEPEKKEEQSPKEYAEEIMSGKVPEKE